MCEGFGGGGSDGGVRGAREQGVYWGWRMGGSVFERVVWRRMRGLLVGCCREGELGIAASWILVRWNGFAWVIYIGYSLRR